MAKVYMGPGPGRKQCPKCERYYASSREKCANCGVPAPPPKKARPQIRPRPHEVFGLLDDVKTFLKQHRSNGLALIEQVRSLQERAGGWDELALYTERAES
jgi:hypothetical protein